VAKAQELEKKFWKALEDDMTVMLGLVGEQDAHTRPMTAQLEDDGKLIWFFSAKDTAMVKKLKPKQKAALAFVSKGHDLFATVSGTLKMDNDPEMIDRLWNRYVAAWYEKGKDDPKLALLCFEPDEAEIWLNGSSLVAGIKMMLGADPKKDYKDHVAKVSM
jgi:general stress protein 26